MKIQSKQKNWHNDECTQLNLHTQTWDLCLKIHCSSHPWPALSSSVVSAQVLQDYASGSEALTFIS